MNWLGILSSTIGLGASLLGQNKQRKELLRLQNKQMQIAQNYLNAQQTMWRPFVDAGYNSLAQTRAFVNEQNAERFSGDRMADIARDRSVSAAYQATARNNANLMASYGANTGRVVGSQMRNERAGADAVSNANFNWAQQVRSKQTQATNAYLQGLTSLNNAGYTGTNAMSQAYNNYANMANQASATPVGSGSGSAWSDIGGILMGIGTDSLLQGMNKQQAPETSPLPTQPGGSTDWGDVSFLPKNPDGTLKPLWGPQPGPLGGTKPYWDLYKWG